MGDLATLAEEVLLAHGALAERQADGAHDALEALLPADLAGRLRLPEHVSLAEGPPRPGVTRLAYGTDLLERLVGLAVGSVPVALATLDEPLRPAADPTATALHRFSGRNCVLRPAADAPAEGWLAYLVVDYRYTADADERREGLLRVAVNEEGGPDVTALHHLDSEPALRPGLAGVPLGAAPDEVVARAARAARRAAAAAVEPLSASIRRRHGRDRARLRDYFAALGTEMQAQLGRLQARGAGAAELEARAAKLAGLQPELGRKLLDLQARYVLRVDVQPVAALRVAVRGLRVPLRLRRRQAERTLVVYQSAAARTFDPVACDACGAGVSSFAACDGPLHLLCAECDARRPSPRYCPACGGRSS